MAAGPMADGSEGDERRDAPQLPLDFDHRASNTRDDLIVAASVEAAVELIERWPDWPSPVVVLAGPAGSGKTHLATIWSERARARPVNIAQWDEKALADAAAGPVLAEDADRRQFDETQLFHVINTVLQNGTHLLMTARCQPALWPVKLPDLRSRLNAATMVAIGAPDDALLAQVIEKLFADRQIAIDPKVVGYMVQRMERSLEAARAIVRRMDEVALARRCKIGRSLAAEVLSEWEAARHGIGIS